MSQNNVKTSEFRRHSAIHVEYIDGDGISCHVYENTPIESTVTPEPEKQNSVRPDNLILDDKIAAMKKLLSKKPINKTKKQVTKKTTASKKIVKKVVKKNARSKKSLGSPAPMKGKTGRTNTPRYTKRTRLINGTEIQIGLTKAEIVEKLETFKFPETPFTIGQAEVLLGATHWLFTDHIKKNFKVVGEAEEKKRGKKAVLYSVR